MNCQPNPHEGLKPDYPAPPPVHWLVLLGAWIALLIPTHFFAPPSIRQMLPNLIFSLWVLYLCLWLRRLSQASRALYWALASIAGDLFLTFFPDNSGHPSWLYAAALGAAALLVFALPFVTIFVIRAELLRHYNQREPIGLKLNPILTLVLSYIYFQYHLFDIAQHKNRNAQNIIENPCPPPIS